MDLLIVVVLGLVLCWFILKLFKVFKIPKLNSLVMVTGGVKTGKSTLSVYMVIKTYKHNVFVVKFKNFFRKIFHKPLKEIPLLYSNVPLACSYIPVTLDLLLRNERFVYGSVVYLQEASLVADSQLIKDKDINNKLLLFFKLFGHETQGGTCIIDTQSISDVHYSLKRSLSEYFYIHHLTKWIPFFLIAHVIENRYSDDGTITTTETQDTELTLRKVIIPKKCWKYFDCYCYSVLTDDLQVNRQVIKNNLQTRNLKAENIVSFRPEFNKEKKSFFEKELEKEKKNNENFIFKK